MRSLRRVQLLVVLGTFAFGTLRAGAADSPTAQADDLIAQGFKLRLQGKNAEALELFTKAHTLAPSAKTLGQIGSVEVALQRWVDAESHLVQALARHDSPWVEVPKNREVLEKTLAEARLHIARIGLNGTPGAEISVDGRRIGALPLAEPVHVAAGAVRVTARASGFNAMEIDLVVHGGEEVSRVLDLTRVAPAMSVPTMPAPALLNTPAAPAESRRPTWRKWTGGGLAAVGVAGVGVGAAWLAMDGRPSCDAPSGTVCKHLYDTKTQGWVALGVGLAAAGAGATLLVWPAGDRSVAAVVGPGSLALSGRF